jgi:hypothetical protein
MTAYMIMDIDVLDPLRYEAYKRDVPRLVEKHGGEYLVRGGEFEVIEGDWNPVRLEHGATDCQGSEFILRRQASSLPATAPWQPGTPA